MTSDTVQLSKSTKIDTERLEGDAIWRVTLNSPKGNVLDAEMTAELTELFVAAAGQPRLKAILLSGEGLHFCFGASVEEHRPDQVAGMLAGFHGLFRAIMAAGVPVIASVRGCCLGGGLELAAFCQRIFAHSGASFGQPEIKLGVFAPVASAILADRIGRGAADDLLLTGRVAKAEEALAMGLVDELVDEPEAAAEEWVRKHFLPLSASSLRFATRAARHEFNRRFERNIDELERLYLGQLMNTIDAPEGISAFLEKREPKWSDA